MATGPRRAHPPRARHVTSASPGMETASLPGQESAAGRRRENARLRQRQRQGTAATAGRGGEESERNAESSEGAHLLAPCTVLRVPSSVPFSIAVVAVAVLAKMQHHALAAVGRAGAAAWSFTRLSSLLPVLPPPLLTGSGRSRAGATAGRVMGTREAQAPTSWAPLRCFSQEASSEMALEKKKCIPCETGKLQAMSEEKAYSLLPEVSGWELKQIDGVLQLHRTWKAKSFLKGLEIMKRVADVAEAEGHHPDLHLVNWNQLSINVSTHAVGGLTENDFIVAAKIGALDLTDLVRKPKVATAK